MKKHVVFLVLISALLVLSCRKQEDKSAKLAEVNGEILTLDSFKSTFSVEDWESLNPETRKRYVEDWVNLTLLAQKADEKEFSNDLGLQQRINYAVKKVKANALIARRLADIKVSEDQLFSYFRIHQAEFSKPALTYKIQRIQLADKLSAERVLNQLNQGMDFGSAVTKYSSEPLKDKAGILGFVSSSSADSVFWFAARDLKINEASLINKDQYWFVFRYTETKESGTEANFEDFRSDIKRRIILEKQEEVYQNLLREIKSGKNEIYYY